MRITVLAVLFAALSMQWAVGVTATAACVDTARAVLHRTTGVLARYNIGQTYSSVTDECNYVGICHQTANLLWLVYAQRADETAFKSAALGSRTSTSTLTSTGTSTLRAVLVQLLTNNKVVLVRLLVPEGHTFVIASESATRWMLLQSYVGEYVPADWLNNLGRTLPHGTAFQTAHALWGNGQWFNPTTAHAIAGVTNQESFLDLIERMEAARTGLRVVLTAEQQARETALFGAPCGDTDNAVKFAAYTKVADLSDTTCETNANALNAVVAGTSTIRCARCVELVSNGINKNKAEFDRLSGTDSHGVVTPLSNIHFTYTTAGTGNFAKSSLLDCITNCFKAPKAYSTYKEVCVAAGMCTNTMGAVPGDSAYIQLNSHSVIQANGKAKAKHHRLLSRQK